MLRFLFFILDSFSYKSKKRIDWEKTLTHQGVLLLAGIENYLVQCIYAYFVVVVVVAVVVVVVVVAAESGFVFQRNGQWGINLSWVINVPRFRYPMVHRSCKWVCLMLLVVGEWMWHHLILNLLLLLMLL